MHLWTCAKWSNGANGTPAPRGEAGRRLHEVARQMLRHRVSGGKHPSAYVDVRFQGARVMSALVQENRQNPAMGRRRARFCWTSRPRFHSLKSCRSPATPVRLFVRESVEQPVLEMCEIPRSGLPETVFLPFSYAIAGHIRYNLARRDSGRAARVCRWLPTDLARSDGTKVWRRVYA